MVADVVFEAIRNDRFYIFPHPDWKEFIRTRLDAILAERDPPRGNLEDVINRLLSAGN